MQALTCVAHLSRGGRFRTRDLHQRAADTLGLTTATYRLSQLRYDLAKLRAKGLVVKVPKTQTYRLTPQGFRICVLLLKLFHRVYAPFSAAVFQPVPADALLPVAPSTNSTPVSTTPSINSSTVLASASPPKRDARSIHRPTPQKTCISVTLQPQ